LGRVHGCDVLDAFPSGIRERLVTSRGNDGDIDTNTNADIINTTCIHSIAIRHFLYPHKPEGAAEVRVRKSLRFLRIRKRVDQCVTVSHSILTDKEAGDNGHSTVLDKKRVFSVEFGRDKAGYSIKLLLRALDVRVGQRRFPGTSVTSDTGREVIVTFFCCVVSFIRISSTKNHLERPSTWKGEAAPLWLAGQDPGMPTATTSISETRRIRSTMIITSTDLKSPRWPWVAWMEHI
jgi:hypothetical protein